VSKLKMDVQEDGAASLREVMGSYPTGVTIVAACDADGDPYGLTVNSFTSVSLDPPLVLVCIGLSSTSHDRFLAASGFCVNILAADQGGLAGRFAKEPSEGRFDEVTWAPGESGSPIIEGSLAWLDCVVHEVFRGGDHSILVGRVVASGLMDGDALIFHRGRLTSSRT
jgi:flavin reductase (DIM6/NTAB) family NADH-FMN oxidoreductase RutF